MISLFKFGDVQSKELEKDTERKEITIDSLATQTNSRQYSKQLLTILNKVLLSTDDKIPKILEGVKNLGSKDTVKAFKEFKGATFKK